MASVILIRERGLERATWNIFRGHMWKRLTSAHFPLAKTQWHNSSLAARESGKGSFLVCMGGVFPVSTQHYVLPHYTVTLLILVFPTRSNIVSCSLVGKNGTF